LIEELSENMCVSVMSVKQDIPIDTTFDRILTEHFK